MNNIKAIGFDLFNTLITVNPQTLVIAIGRLIDSLRESGFSIEEKAFKRAYREKAFEFVEQARKEGRETHNRFWISAALQEGGILISPDDTRIGDAIERYFSAFYENTLLIPGTEAMLSALRDRYPLGLLSNFTHGPAAREILRRKGLNSFFKTIIISGELGFRKPYYKIFQALCEGLEAPVDQILYVGDDPDPDIHGAREAGLQPVWMTYVKDNNIPMARGLLLSDTEKPDFEVPRISSWQDLFSLLKF